jgi:hypothetical protein
MNLKIMEHGFCAERPNLGIIGADSSEGEGFERYGKISNLGFPKFVVATSFQNDLICKTKFDL